nr:hypothetical protein [Candidatus Ichthyocystis sparus]
MRDFSLVIHWLSPDESAVRPSREKAIFNLIHGFPYNMRLKKPQFRAIALSDKRPICVVILLERSFSILFPHTKGLGSSDDITTLLTPPSMIRFMHGGVSPW